MGARLPLVRAGHGPGTLCCGGRQQARGVPRHHLEASKVSIARVFLPQGLSHVLARQELRQAASDRRGGQGPPLLPGDRVAAREGRQAGAPCASRPTDAAAARPRPCPCSREQQAQAPWLAPEAGSQWQWGRLAFAPERQCPQSDTIIALVLGYGGSIRPPAGQRAAADQRCGWPVRGRRWSFEAWEPRGGES